MRGNGSRPGGRRRGPFGRLYHGETAIDFVGRATLWFGLSALVILVGLGSLAIRGLNLGIDFRGGTSWVVAGDVDVDAARDAVARVGVAGADV
ncbi:MAG: protein translocase subunit SecF, partial [Actinomycetota bacterium]|nr:protein translocase subunit SecF [Actinomycetota bacterium]